MNTTKHKLVLSHIVCIVSVNGHISNIAAVPIHTLVYKHTLISTLKNQERTEENKMRMCVDIARELRLCCGCAAPVRQRHRGVWAVWAGPCKCVFLR